MSSPYAQPFVNAHNNYRRKVNPPAKNMPMLVWADDLADNASKWAAKCQWAHSGTPGVGENIYATSVRNDTNPNNAVNSWDAEKSNYNYANNTCAPGAMCGHYTQLVWANSKNLGCAIQDCPKINGINWPNGGTFVVCQYTPPGNYIGQKPYQRA